MSSKPARIVIVGGGTAGWMTAAFLERKLSSPSGEPVSITLIESDEIPPIGVGEATIPSIVAMMRELEIAEYRLFSEADATFKNAIKFVGWNTSAGSPGPADEFFHQFDPPPVLFGHDAVIHWMALRAAGIEMEPLWDATAIGSALCRDNRAPKLFQSQPYEAPIPYAYHIDAAKLGQVLRTTAESRGVIRVEGRVESADLDADGSIVAVQTSDGLDIEGDFFVDCSGFRAILIDKVLKTSFVSFADRLICDSAVTCQLPHVDGKPTLRPYTTCTAQDAGWTWEIDLQSRTGAGYVYSSQFTSDEQAREALVRQMGKRAEAATTRNISMRIGRRTNFWVKNCLGVGLSAGFLEPLESTGIHLIELGLRVFAEHFDLASGPSAARCKYNELMRNVFDETAEFLIMHYNLNGRRGEPFWDYCRERLVLPQTLVEKLQLWSVKAPSSTDLHSRINVFSGFSYATILNGLGITARSPGNLSPFIDLKKSAEALDNIRASRSLAVKASPPHEDMVQKLRAIGG